MYIFKKRHAEFPVLIMVGQIHINPLLMFTKKVSRIIKNKQIK